MKENNPQPTQTPPPSSSHSDSKLGSTQPTKKRKEKWILITIAIILFVLFVIYSFLTWRTGVMTESWNNAENAAMNYKKPLFTPTPSINSMDEWKTYRNEEYGFEFKYPDNWHLNPLIADPTIDSVLVAEKAPENSQLLDHLGSHLGIKIEPNPKNANPSKQWYLDRLKEIPAGIKSEAYEVNETMFKGFSAINVNDKEVYFSKNNYLYHFSWSYGSDSDLNKKIIDQILSTFRFLDETNTGEELVSWSQAVNYIQNCNVDMVFQTHTLKVTLTLKDGSKVTATEPAIDDVFEVVRNAETKCGKIPIATE